MIRDDEVYKIGVIGKTHGVKGELNFTFTDDVFDRVDADYLILRIDGILVPFFIDEYRFRSDDRALIIFNDIDSTEKAQSLVGIEVFFPYALSDKAKDDTISFNDLIGFTIEGIGTITGIDDYTDNILFEVKTDNEKQILIPAVDEFVEYVDYDKRIIKVNLPEGLLDLN
ncbi:MAG: ribosome maturation factor RimM [Prevotellaceae bacterium]|nr:ribosome maturation factor RimM [Prevotellaceae bacterium]